MDQDKDEDAPAEPTLAEQLAEMRGTQQQTLALLGAVLPQLEGMEERILQRLDADFDWRRGVQADPPPQDRPR